jgi:hypothetical protein
MRTAHKIPGRFFGRISLMASRYPKPQNQNKPHSKTGRVGNGRLPKRPPFIADGPLTDLLSAPGKGNPMHDELDRLRTKNNLLLLLKHYADLAGPSRETWQDRLMAMEGFEPQEISKLHGELIAFSWIEQNTGNISVLRAGAVPACYRVTLAGLRAVQQIQAPEAVVDLEMPIVEEKPILKRIKRKSREPELVGAPV